MVHWNDKIHMRTRECPALRGTPTGTVKNEIDTDLTLGSAALLRNRLRRPLKNETHTNLRVGPAALRRDRRWRL